MYYLIKFKNKEYTIPKYNLKLFAMTIGIYSSTVDECIKMLKHQGIEVLEFDENKEQDLWID